MDEVPISQARDQLGEIVSRAAYARQPTVLTRRGKPIAAVIPYEELPGREADAPTPPTPTRT
jgi:prevent-host-death family protein